jgi:hypothetical protein
MESCKVYLFQHGHNIKLDPSLKRRVLGHPEFLLNIVFKDIYFVPLKESRRAKGADQVLQNYVHASWIPKKKFVAKQFA